MAPVDELVLDEQQVRFFESFGFLKVPGVFADEVEAISPAFDAAFEAEETPFFLPSDNAFHTTDDPRYQEELRQIIPALLDHTPGLTWIKDDPRLTGVVRSLLGDHFLYQQSDGNLFNCDVLWHTDLYGADLALENIKFFFYLESLRADSGALRVLPGTHFREGSYGPLMRRDLYLPDRFEDLYGMDPDQLPAHVVEVEPGDLVVMNFRLLHGSWNGPPGRRLFTVNFAQQHPPDESSETDRSRADVA